MFSSYQILIDKLNEFIKKYYTNQLLRGLMVSGAFIVASFIAINILEYYFYLSSLTRKILFFGFIFSSFLLFVWLILLPLLKIYKLGKTLSYEEASKIIGTHFSEVKDKLLNVLQLQKDASISNQDNTLLEASINQKINELKPISFPKAVDFTQNKKYLKFLIPPICIFLFILFGAPSIFKDGTKRLFYNDQFFEKEMPFSINIQNKKLEALQQDNFLLQIKTDGKALPDKVSIKIGELIYDMKKVDKTTFEYEFTNLQKSQEFQFIASEFITKPYTLTVLAKPFIVSFDVLLHYPAYTGKSNETIKNTGDLNVPQGTNITWIFYTKETDNIKLVIDNKTVIAKKESDNKYSYSQAFSQNSNYSMMVSNQYLSNNDSVAYSISVIPDQNPELTVEEFKDSANIYSLFYSGDATDDYGLSSIRIIYDIQRADSNKSSKLSKNLPCTKGSKYSQFTHYLDIRSMEVNPGDVLTYYFEAVDIAGKTTRSQIKQYKSPTINEREELTDKNNNSIKKDLEKSIKESQEIAKEMKKMQEKLLDKKQADWQDKKQLQDLINRQKTLQENVEKLQQKLEQNNQQQSEYKEVDPEIKEKQKQLEKLMDELLSDEMKEMIKKLEKMMEQLNKQQMMKNTEEMKMNDEKLNKELDRMLELFKKIEQEQKIKETAEKLDKLAQDEEKLSQESKEKNQDNKELKEKQEKLNQQMDELKKEMKDIDKMNESMEDKTDMKEATESMDKASEEMQKSSDELSKNDKKSASESQKKASENMKDAAQKMRDKLSQEQADQMEEDMNSIRHLLENLITLSFDQEQNMAACKKATINTPLYVSLIQKQKKIAEDSKMVEDSLYALAKRQIKIESIVTKEITDVNKHHKYALESLEDRRVGEGTVHQQFVMTGYNNLALMLSEALQQMQQQMMEMKNKKPGDGSCKKPGGKGAKPSASQLSKMQQQLNDQMQKMGEMIKSGQMKPGDKGYSKEMAEMARQQAAIREALQELNKNESGDGKTAGSFQKLAQQMNQTETELVNKRLTEEMLRRQQDISVRLLEFEKAQKERGEKEEREAVNATDKAVKLPPSLEEYLKKRNQEIELYKTLPPNLKPFYKNMVQEYYKAVGK
jgi:hypothetical protein